MRISQLAKSAGVGVETVRYYQHLGLLTTPQKPHAGFRTYTEVDLARLRFIKRAQQLGFSLDDIAGMLRLSGAACPDVQALAHRKLDLVQRKIADLARIEGVLQDVLKRCSARKPHEGCPVIASLNSAA
ncbi:MAG: MerR family DNA-binding protein [Stenotrophobium sp.]